MCRQRLGEALKQFEEQWGASTFPGWEGVKPAESHEPIDLSKFHSAAELEQLGMEALKGGLLALGLKCGGTLQQRAARLFSVKAKSPEQFDKNIVAKKSAKVGHVQSTRHLPCIKARRDTARRGL